MKYDNRPEIGRRLAMMAAEQLSKEGFFDGIDAIVPLPLSKKKKRQRGYNQCDCIADGISEVMEGRVRGVWILEDGSQKFDIIIKGYFPHRYTPEDFGKTVFLTREEAEAKLKEGGKG